MYNHLRCVTFISDINRIVKSKLQFRCEFDGGGKTRPDRPERQCADDHLWRCSILHVDVVPTWRFPGPSHMGIRYRCGRMRRHGASLISAWAPNDGSAASVCASGCKKATTIKRHNRKKPGHPGCYETGSGLSESRDKWESKWEDALARARASFYGLHTRRVARSAGTVSGGFG